MRVVNFAHGELYMLGAFFLYTLFSLAGLNFFVSSALAVVGVGMVGAVIERLVLRRLRDQPIEIPMLATVALSVIIQNAAILLWDPSPKTIKHVFSPVPFTLGPVHMVWIRLCRRDGRGPHRELAPRDPEDADRPRHALHVPGPDMARSAST